MSKPVLLEKDIIFTPSPKLEDITNTSKVKTEADLENKKGSTIKVPLAILGRWRHSSYGKVEFTQQDFDYIKEGFEKDVLGHTPYITLGHLDEEHHSTDSHRKRGNLLSINQEGDVLYGVFDVKPKVYNWVADGDYEYVSGEFIRGFLDKEGKEVGTVLLRVALTNSPFLPFGKHKNVALSLNNKSIDLDNHKLQLFSLKTNITMQNPKNKVKPDEPQNLSSTVIEPPTKSQEENNKVEESLKETEDADNKEKVESSEDKGEQSDTKSNLTSSEEKEQKGDEKEGEDDSNQELSSTESAASTELENKTKEEEKEEEEKEEEKDKESDSIDNEHKKELDKESNINNNLDGGLTSNQESTTQEDMNAKAEETNSQNLSQTDARSPQFSNVLMNKDGVNVKALYEGMRKCFSQKYQNDLAQRDLEIKGLQEQLLSLSQTLEETKNRTEKQQLSIRDTQSQAVSALEGMLTEYLGGAGVPPALIRKFSTLKDAINSRLDTVKLSLDNNTVEEITTIQLLADMLIEAVNTNNIPLQQLGISKHMTRLNNDPSGRNGAALQTIERNIDKARSLGRI